MAATMNGKQTGRNGQGGSRTRATRRGASADGNARPKPVHTIRMGALKAAIWENQIANGVIHNVTVSRTYKVEDEYRESQSFGFDDLLPLAKALNAAHSWINDARAKAREQSRQATQEDGAGQGNGQESEAGT